MAVVALGDNMTILVGRPYVARITGAESVQTTRFSEAMLAAGFRRASGFLSGAQLDPTAFRVTQLENGAIATELDFESDHEDGVRNIRAAIAVAVWQSGGGRPSSVEIGESRVEGADAERPTIGGAIGNAIEGATSAVVEVARVPIYLAILGIVGFGIYLYARS